MGYRRCTEHVGQQVRGRMVAYSMLSRDQKTTKELSFRGPKETEMLYNDGGGYDRIGEGSSIRLPV